MVLQAKQSNLRHVDHREVSQQRALHARAQVDGAVIKILEKRAAIRGESSSESSSDSDSDFMSSDDGF
jgi:hypothetical protein